MVTRLRCKKTGEIIEFDIELKTDQHYVLKPDRDKKMKETEKLHMDDWEVYSKNG